MDLLFNVFLTDSKGNAYQTFDRGFLRPSSKLDITKYALASLSSIPFSKVTINIELDKKIYSEKDYEELEEFVKLEFSNHKLSFNRTRNLFQKDWINFYDEIESDLILLLCNHDHIFLNSNLAWFEDIASTKCEGNETFTTSHWVENVRWAKSGYIELNEIQPRKFNDGYRIYENHLEYRGICIDSLNVITKEIYKDWFFTGNWGDFKLPRVDGIGQGNLMDLRKHFGIPLIPQKIMIPYKEQFRHFDGYMHQRISNRVCPALQIPEGFFDRDVKVRYGYQDHKEGWVNINPKNKKYSAEDLGGTEDKITFEDIPIFWKTRISEVDINERIEEEEMIQYRLQAVLEQMYFDDRYNPYIEQEVENKVMKEYLKVYESYKLA